MNKLRQLLSANARADVSKLAIRSDASGDVGHIYVYDVIDSTWGASAKDLVQALAGMGNKDVHMHVNSPGGDVFEARAMVAAVSNYPGKVVAYIDGLAASAATYLALSADETHIIDGGMFMVHNSWTLTWGNKHEMRTTADLLDKIDSTISADYARKTKASQEQITQWMDAETWFTAAEALDAGFVDSVVSTEKKSAAAKWDLSAYDNAPKAADPPEPAPEELAAQADRQSRLNRSRLALASIPRI
jgi:ATP-dependent Clp protease protease subunit